MNLDNYVQVVYGVVEGEDISLAERTRHLYTYRTDGKKYAIGDIVTVPPTSRTGFTGDPVVVTVIKKGSTYKGPTHAVIRKHRHTFKTIYVCECGKTHE